MSECWHYNFSDIYRCGKQQSEVGVLAIGLLGVMCRHNLTIIKAISANATSLAISHWYVQYVVAMHTEGVSYSTDALFIDSQPPAVVTVQVSSFLATCTQYHWSPELLHSQVF